MLVLYIYIILGVAISMVMKPLTPTLPPRGGGRPLKTQGFWVYKLYLLLWSLVAFFCLGSPALYASARFWDAGNGGCNGNWSKSQCWHKTNCTGATGVPSNNDTVTIDASCSAQTGVTVDANTSNLTSLTLSAGTLTVNNAIILSVTGNGAPSVSITGSATMTITGATGEMDVKGTLTVGGASAGTLTNNGIVDMTSATGAFTNNSNGTVSGTGTFKFAGNWTNNNNFQMTGGTTTFSGGNVNLTPNSTTDQFYDLTVSETAGTTLTLLTNKLTVADNLSVTSGTLALGAITGNTVTGSLTNRATITMSGDLTVGGAWDNSAGTFAPAAGTVTLNSGSANVTPSATDNFYNLTINSTGTKTVLTNRLKVNNNLTVTAGTLDLSTVSGHTLSKNGSITGTLSMSSGGSLTTGSTTILTVNSGGNFTVSGGTVTMGTGSSSGITVSSGGTFTMSSGTITTPTPGTDRFAFTVNGTINLTGGTIKSMTASGLNLSSGATITALNSVSFYNHPGGSATDSFITLAENSLNLDITGEYFDSITLGCNIRVTGTGGVVHIQFKDTSTNGPGGGEPRDCDNDADEDGLADSGGTVVYWVNALQTSFSGTLIGSPTTAIDLNTFTAYSTYIVAKDISGVGTNDRIYVLNPTTGALKSYSYDVTQANGDIVCGVFWTTESSQHIIYFGTSAGKLYRLVDDATKATDGTALTLSSDWPESLPGTSSAVTSCTASDRTNLYLGGSDNCTSYVAASDTCNTTGSSSNYMYAYTTNNITNNSGTKNKFRLTTSGEPVKSAFTWWQSGSNFYLFCGSDASGGNADIFRVDINAGSINATCTGSGGACTRPVGNVRALELSSVGSSTDLFFGDSTGEIYGVDPFAALFPNLSGFPFTDGTHSAPAGCGSPNAGVIVPARFSTPGIVYYGDEDGHFYVLNSTGTKYTGYPIIPDTDTSSCHSFNYGGVKRRSGYIYIGNNNGKFFKISYSAATVSHTWNFGSGVSLGDVAFSFFSNAFVVMTSSKVYWIPP